MMHKKELCPRCKTGKCAYELDRHSPMCPYFYCHNGKKCSMYKKLNDSKKRSFLKRILDMINTICPSCQK